MKQQRNKFWTVVFSLMPGAGHMFMGFMKMGVSIMGEFFLIIAAASLTGISPLLFLLPILWFYSFFDAINKCYADRETFESMEDQYLFPVEKLDLPKGKFFGKYRVIGGIVLVLLGLFLIWNNFIPQILSALSRLNLSPALLSALYTMTHSVPELVIAVIIIIIGVRLIMGKKKELDEND